MNGNRKILHLPDDLLEIIEEHTKLVPRSYSGRGMMGRECVGITCDNPINAIFDILQAVIGIEWFDDIDRGDLFSEVVEALRNPSQDSMGKSSIIYWPRLAWPEGRLDSDEGFDDEDEEE